MRVRSWEQAGLHGGRTVAFVFLVGGSFFAMVVLTGTALRLGAVTFALGGLTAVVAAYLVASAPRRVLSRAAFQQTLEAPAFAAASGIYLMSTCSRSKTFMMLSSEEPRLRAFLSDAKRTILTGHGAGTAVKDGRAERKVLSESVMSVLHSVSGLERGRIESGSDEVGAILSSAALEEETKLPLFMAVSFFLPIMLMLFAAMTKSTGPVAVVALVVLEVVILDIALSVSRSSAGWATQGRTGG